MTQERAPIALARRLQLEHRAASVERFLQRHKAGVIVFLSLVYFGGTILRARGKPFWFDEILTLLAARQETYSATIQAARDLDWTPPFTDLVGHFVYRLAGAGEVVFRIPSMIGFWIFCLCLFGFVARRVNMCFALLALLLPFATGAESYSFEARSYGMMLGFSGIALLSWQFAASGRMRRLGLAGVCLGINGALFCHYSAIMIYLPLGVAEVYRNFRERKIDIAVWAALISGTLSLGLATLGISRIAKASSHPFILTTPHDYLQFYIFTFGPSLWFLMPCLALLAVWLLVGGDQEEPAAIDHPKLVDHELLAAILLLLIPVVAITAALVLPPHVFMYRYALLSVAGFVILTALLANTLAGRRLAVAMAVAVPAIAVFAYAMTQGRHSLQSPFQQEPLLASALERGPVAVNNTVAYMQLWYYAPEAVKPRLLYLSDEEAFVKYTNIDEVVLAFQKYGVPIVNYKDFAYPGKDFLLYFIPGLGWLPDKALDDGGSVQVVEWSRGKALLHIRLK